MRRSSGLDRFGRISPLADGWTRVSARVTAVLRQRDTSFWRNDLLPMCPEWTPWEARDRGRRGRRQAGSLVFDERLAFVRVAYFREVGFKFGRWLDLVFLQRTLYE